MLLTSCASFFFFVCFVLFLLSFCFFPHALSGSFVPMALISPSPFCLFAHLFSYTFWLVLYYFVFYSTLFIFFACLYIDNILFVCVMLYLFYCYVVVFVIVAPLPPPPLSLISPFLLQSFHWRHRLSFWLLDYGLFIVSISFLFYIVFFCFCFFFPLFTYFITHSFSFPCLFSVVHFTLAFFMLFFIYLLLSYSLVSLPLLVNPPSLTI